MKPQEVINIIEDVTWNDNGRHYGKINTAREMAIEALEKQTPKKAVLASMDGFKPEYASTLICPTCSKPIVNVWNKKDYKPKYCHYCGQALDWSENNGTD